MDQPGDLDTARKAFVDAVTREDRFAAAVPPEAAEAAAKAICKTCNVCTNANIQVCSEKLLQTLS